MSNTARLLKRSGNKNLPNYAQETVINSKSLLRKVELLELCRLQESKPPKKEVQIKSRFNEGDIIANGKHRNV